jgi:hypothetical protein
VESRGKKENCVQSRGNGENYIYVFLYRKEGEDI